MNLFVKKINCNVKRKKKYLKKKEKFLGFGR